MLCVERVTKVFKGKKAVDGASFSVKKGEIFAILGHSGSGKSTILRIIAGLERADGGDVVLESNSILKLPAQKRNISMMFQNYALLPHLSVKQNITLDRKYDKVHVLDILKKMRLSELSDMYPAELSGGQQQRVALARALIRNPKIVLLDEPFSSVDPSLKKELREELLSVIKSFAMTAIIVTHDRDDAFCLADRGAFVREGRVVQIGTVRELYSEPLDRYCAEFFGDINEIDEKRARLLRIDKTFSDTLLIRPNKIFPSSSGAKAVVTESKFFGDFFEYKIESAGIPLVMHTAERFGIGEEILIQIK